MTVGWKNSYCTVVIWWTQSAVFVHPDLFFLKRTIYCFCCLNNRLIRLQRAISWGNLSASNFPRRRWNCRRWGSARIRCPPRLIMHVFTSGTTHIDAAFEYCTVLVFITRTKVPQTHTELTAFPFPQGRLPEWVVNSFWVLQPHKDIGLRLESEIDTCSLGTISGLSFESSVRSFLIVFENLILEIVVFVPACHCEVCYTTQMASRP